ncbi:MULTISPECIES: rhodanese-like domain-containing protein [Actinokineospora]|uniref:Sulfurtransferase n=1 Tax=Actinokineospora fastidiosa TaxID=1816 RepID=A0A918G5J9_9PSEU|nr:MULTISPECIES: rhodanese-like domain-containing protein [Actinokineospora]UVS76408.1 Thiosulfate sulfurtransferase GlpE [Actinokineospora sp. UTMC 2448]GGS18416.1 sulfurtransferase [Actinokineospora fastidiosa]
MNVPGVAASEIPSDATLLDVREQDEWDAGHAPGALHIPMGELAGRLDELPDAPLHVICRSGGRSARVTAYLNANGWDAVNVEGGMQSWAAGGRPMAAETGAPPEVV